MTSASLFVCFELERIYGFSIVAEKYLSQHRADFETWVNANAATLNEEERNEMLESYSEEYHSIAEELPRTLRYSILVALYSELENLLLGSATQAGHKKQMKLHLEDLKGEGIELARMYFKKVLGLPFPDNEPEWASVTFLQRIRNKIVHEGGRIAESNAKLRKEIASHEGLEINNLNRLTIGESFATAQIDEAAAFIRKLDSTTFSRVFLRPRALHGPSQDDESP